MYANPRGLFLGVHIDSLGDLYGAIGSPVRLTRTVVVGKQKDLVQRILYVLTYFLRCSELQENQLTWSGNHSEGDQVINGSKIVTALEKGEVEESEYVVVTVRNEPALVPPILPPAVTERRSPGPTGLAGTPEGTDIREMDPRPDKEGNKRPDQGSEACSMGFQEPELDSSWKPNPLCGDEGSEKEAPHDGPLRFPRCAIPGAEMKISQPVANEELKEEITKKLPDRSAAWPCPCPNRHSRENPPVGKVTFQIGSSLSPESDFESRTKKMEERLKACGQYPEVASISAESSVAADMAQSQQVSRCSFKPGFQKNVCCPQNRSSDGEEGESDRGFAEDRGIRPDAAADAGQLSQAVPTDSVAGTGRRTLEKTRGLYLKDVEGPSLEPAPDRCVQQDSGLLVAADVPCGDADRKADFRIEGDIPRNESSDSALGDSDDEACASATLDLDHSGDRTEGTLEVELPLPR